MAAPQAVRHEVLLPLNGQLRRRGYLLPQGRTRQRMHLSKMSSRERAGYQLVTASTKPDQEAPSSSTSSLSRLEGTDLQPAPGPQQHTQKSWTILGLEPSAELAAIALGAVPEPGFCARLWPSDLLCIDGGSCVSLHQATALAKRACFISHSGRTCTKLLHILSAVYFVQGILGLARLAVTYLFKDEFKLDPATVGLESSTCP